MPWLAGLNASLDTHVAGLGETASPAPGCTALRGHKSPMHDLCSLPLFWSISLQTYFIRRGCVKWFFSQSWASITATPSYKLEMKTLCEFPGATRTRLGQDCPLKLIKGDFFQVS